MGDLWRSEPMQLIQLIIPTDAAHETIAELGELGLLQFKDLNPEREAFARAYASQVKRCNEMSRRLRYFHEQVSGAEIPMAGAIVDVGTDLDEMEGKLEELEKELTVINENSERLKKSEAELIELQLVLQKAAQFFDEARVTAHGNTAGDSDAVTSVDVPLLDDAPEAVKATRLGFTAGTINVENLVAFERLLFRATRGNMFLRSSDVGTVLDPNTNKLKQKAVFVVFYAGERAKLKITKTCEAFNANRYPFPEETVRQRQMYAEVSTRLHELSSTIAAGNRRRDGVLANLAQSLQSWITVVRREKAVYHTMNMLSFDVTRQALVAEAWAPLDGRVPIQSALQRATVTSNATVGTIYQPLATHEQPPTYFKTTLFTQCFHDIVQAYGVARYLEINPTTFSVITFPFLFAVMFGDVGHALIMVVFALLLLSREKAMLKQKLSDIESMIFGGRYVILLMGFFSIFTGFMYNEFFSMPMALFGHTKYTCRDGAPGTSWRDCAKNATSSVYTTGLELPTGSKPYQFGLDPIWHGMKTELTFVNSVKMKMSIVMGVVHMTLGIVMSLFNHLFFRDRLSLLFEFIPQMVFFLSLFGYLAFAIMYKWVSAVRLQELADEACEAQMRENPAITSPAMCTTRSAMPDLYGVLIDMFLSPGTISNSARLFAGQGFLQVVLLLSALVSVPLMLLVKPFVLRKRHQQRTQDPELGVAEGSLEPNHGAGDHDEEFNFGDIMVHQSIHTIEFVLGAVSNTASYLRLWALSLAHAELSAVIYDQILMQSLKAGNIMVTVVGAFMWFIATMAVLMGMESLSAFLHALRLHWLEYMNKFYHGDGELFAPFAFSDIDKDESFLTGASRD